MKAIILLATILAAHSARRRNHIKFKLAITAGARLPLRVGSQPHSFIGQLDTKSPNLIIMDSGCHSAHREVHCPVYCGVAAFRSAYCSQLCEKASPNELAIRCGLNYLFDSAKSATFEDLRNDVTEGFGYLRPLYGRRARDSLQITTPIMQKTLRLGDWNVVVAPYYNRLNDSRVEFVRGFAFDRRYLYRTGGGVVGIAPQSTDGKLSLIPQLKAAGILDSARLSVQIGNPPLFLSSFATSNVIFGALDMYACHDWKRIPSQRGWEFEISDLIFAGWKVEGVNFGRITFDTVHTAVPKYLAEKLVAERLFTLQALTGVYLAIKDAPAVHLEFTAGNHSIRVGPLDQLIANADSEHRYADESQWIFSTRLLRWHCFGYDYEVGAVMWGERRLEIVQ